MKSIEEIVRESESELYCSILWGSSLDPVNKLICWGRKDNTS
jgi:hypothetical protein